MTSPPPSPAPEWLDSQYNNRALVPDHASYFARWASRSAAARQSQACTVDLAYGDGPMETLDIFPTRSSNAPVLVFIHGGYWRSLDKSDHSFLAPAFTSQGACVVVPNYALCPAVTIPKIAQQSAQALAWVWRNVARYGGDPSRITVVGHSAGGHLAAMLLTCNWRRVAPDLPANLINRALSISGLYDLNPIMNTPFLQASLRLTPADAASVSPALFPAPHGKTLYTVAGADESSEFLRHNQLIADAWGHEVVPVCESLAGLNHFSVLEALVQPGHRLQALASQMWLK